MTALEFRQKWEARREEWSRLGISALAGPLLAEVLADLDSVARDEGTELLTLTQAAIRSGYRVDTVGRMVRSGKLANLGRKNAPRVRAADLPRKPLRYPARPLHVRPASRQTARASRLTPQGGD